MSTMTAELSDGRTLEYVIAPNPPAGGAKRTYFAPDKSYVVQFYHDLDLCKDPSQRARLDKLVGPFNPTLDPTYGAYWRGLFCWPTGIVVKPRLGVVYPAWPANFYFSDGPFKGKQKQVTWFVSERPWRMLPEKERGSWIDYFRICILLTRAVRRLHQAGLAHSDLSPGKILLDPPGGNCMMIGIEDLIVPGIFPRDVISTPGYMAPEVQGTMRLQANDPKRQHASTATDAHVLAVWVYPLLLRRHPLRGPKIHYLTDTAKDEDLAMGDKALFIENPHDQSNRPADLKFTYDVLGPLLSPLVGRAFVEGLHNPALRPAAKEWIHALHGTWDLKVDCHNPSCTAKWFIFNPANPICPFCGWRRRGAVPILRLRKQARPEQWLVARELVVYNNQQLFEWHALDNRFPSETVARAQLAHCVFHEGQWLLINEGLPTLTSPSGNRVPIGQAVALTHGAVFRFSDDPHSFEAEVHVMNG